MQALRRIMKNLWALSLLCTAGTAVADPEADYRAGFNAYLIEDLPNAMMFLGKAADAGHAKAQSLLGYIYDKAEENQEALRYYRMSASQGDSAGEYGLGALYASGEGVERNYREAVRWFAKAVEQGHGPAIAVLATSYLEGGLGLEEDRDKALNLLRRGAALGDESARQHLKRLSREAATQ